MAEGNGYANGSGSGCKMATGADVQMTTKVKKEMTAEKMTMQKNEYSEIDEMIKRRRMPKRDAHFTVWGFLYTDFELDITELLIYSLILSYYTAGKEFCGSVEHICNFTKRKKSAVYKAIYSLLEKEYIYRSFTVGRGMTMPIYYINEDKLPKDIEIKPGKQNKGARERLSCYGI